MNQIAPRQQFSLVPANMSEALQLAELIAASELVPKHLQKKPADCLLVIEQAMRWNLSPFAAAQETSVIQGKLMYSGKLTAAVVNALGNLAGRLSYYYDGSGDTRSVTVVGRFADEDTPREVEVTLKEAKTVNQMWVKQPDQQLAYFGVRKWARLHAPDLMLGIYSPEEDITETSSPRRPVSIAPNLMQALPAPELEAPETPHDGDGVVVEEAQAAEVEPDSDDPTLHFVKVTKELILNFTNPKSLSKWWNSDEQKQARNDYELNQEQRNELRAAVEARRDALLAEQAA